MAIGVFGDVIFETSDKRILNFSKFKISSASRYAEHKVIQRKPKLEYVGPGLDKVSFTINLNGNFGVKPIDEMIRWITMSNEGQAHTLVIGSSPIGSDKWVIETVTEVWESIFNRGELYSGKIDVTLKEYISVIESVIKPNMIEPVKATPTNTKTGIVTATVLNVREGPSLSAKIIGKLIKGASVTIIDTSGKWYKINYGTGIAYVYSRYIKVV